jgi:hypothetical protein
MEPLRAGEWHVIDSLKTITHFVKETITKPGLMRLVPLRCIRELEGRCSKDLRHDAAVTISGTAGQTRASLGESFLSGQYLRAPLPQALNATRNFAGPGVLGIGAACAVEAFRKPEGQARPLLFGKLKRLGEQRVR